MTGRGLRAASLAARAGVLLAIVLAAGCQSTHAAVVATGPRFSIVTYNTYYESSDRDATIDVLERSDADIAVLQEVTPALEEQIRAELKGRYNYMLFHAQSGGGGLGIVSRFPVTDRFYMPSPVQKFPAWVFSVITPVGEVEILTIHLHPPVNDRDYFSLPALLKGHMYRIDEMREFAGHMRGYGPRIVAGDFNENERGVAVRFLEGEGYLNALPEYDRVSHTWALWGRVKLISGRLDHILYTEPLVCYDARVLGYGGSDHRAVIASFKAVPEDTAPGQGTGGLATRPFSPQASATSGTPREAPHGTSTPPTR